MVLEVIVAVCKAFVFEEGVDSEFDTSERPIEEWDYVTSGEYS